MDGRPLHSSASAQPPGAVAASARGAEGRLLGLGSAEWALLAAAPQPPARVQSAEARLPAAHLGMRGSLEKGPARKPPTESAFYFSQRGQGHCGDDC